MNDALTIILSVLAAVLVVTVGLTALLRSRGKRELPPSASQGWHDGGGATVAPTIQTEPAVAEAHPVAPVDTEPVQPSAGVDTPTTEVAAPEVAVPTYERPEPVRGRLTRLRARLARSNSSMGKALLAILGGGSLNEAAWEDVEDTLISADLGVGPTNELVTMLRQRVASDGVSDEETMRGWLRSGLLELVDPTLDRRLAASRKDGHPAVILVVGVNGTGKTTTVGRLARVLVAEDKDVLLGAADTFRAAASDQLVTWGDRVGVATITSEKEGGDPAAVAYEAVRAGIESECDVVIIDTAGRLHTKVGLMDELGKVKRVVEKLTPVDEVLLVLDATTGQNGMRQAEVFRDVVNITGIVLTKLDGTAKGGIVVAVQRELGVPVKLVGLGEGPDDLAPFDPEAFVDAIVGD